MSLSKDQLKKYQEYLEKQKKPEVQKFDDGGEVLSGPAMSEEPLSYDEIQKGYGKYLDKLNDPNVNSPAADPERQKQALIDEISGMAKDTDEDEDDNEDTDEDEDDNEDTEKVPSVLGTEANRDTAEAQRANELGKLAALKQEAATGSDAKQESDEEPSDEDKDEVEHPEKTGEEATDAALQGEFPPGTTDVPEAPISQAAVQAAAGQPQQQSINPALDNLQHQIFANQFLKGITQISHGIARAPGQADVSGFDANSKQAEQMYLLQQEAQKEDPKSDYSKSYRALASKVLGKPIDDNVSGTVLEKALPMLKQDIMQQMLMERLASTHTEKELDRGSKEKIAANRLAGMLGRQATKDETDFDKVLEAKKGKRGLLNEPEMIRQRTAELIDNLNTYKNWDDVPQTIKDEYIQLFAGLGAAGANSDTKFKSIDPKTAKGKMSEIWSYLSGDPTGAGQGQFLKMFADSARDRAQTAQGIIDDENIKAGKKAERQIGSNSVKAILATEGIDADKYDSWNPKQTTISKSIGTAPQPASNVIPSSIQSQLKSNEIVQKKKDGSWVVYDKDTKTPLRAIQESK